MNVNCLSCGHSLDLREAYDHYRGQIRCFICGALLTLHSEDGQVISVVLSQSGREGVVSAPERTG